MYKYSIERDLDRLNAYDLYQKNRLENDNSSELAIQNVRAACRTINLILSFQKALKPIRNVPLFSHMKSYKFILASLYENHALKLLMKDYLSRDGSKTCIQYTCFPEVNYSVISHIEFVEQQ